MKKVELTREELLNISSVLEDITIGCEDVAGLYDKPTIYKVAYRRYRRNQNSK